MKRSVASISDVFVARQRCLIPGACPWQRPESLGELELLSNRTPQDDGL